MEFTQKESSGGGENSMTGISKDIIFCALSIRPESHQH